MEKHPNKEIREAVEYAIKKGWIIEKSKGHAWGIMYCPYNDDNCRCGQHCITSIWTTPKNPSNFARQIKRIIRNCMYYQEE